MLNVLKFAEPALILTVRTEPLLNVVVIKSPMLIYPVESPIWRESTRNEEIYPWPELIELNNPF